jgi:cap2 methyltransferase
MSDKKQTVRAFYLPPVDDLKCTHIRKYRIDHGKSEEELKKTKTKMDKPYEKNSKKFSFITGYFNMERDLRNYISKTYNTPHVTNAWLKIYELYTHYKLIPYSADKFTYFDNAAFPGTFILATWHMVKTFGDIKEFKWYGSSLLAPDDKKVLEDKYRLYKSNPQRWLMNKDNDGDVTKISNIKNIKKRIGGTIDLYTSDLGFDVSSDYNRQEEFHAHANLGQIIYGLVSLKQGGSMVTKQYTYYLPFTASLMGIMTSLFKRVEIAKPMTSRPGNSETYLVCIGYNRKDKLIDLLIRRLGNFNLKPLTTKKCLGDDFIGAIQKSQRYFTKIQIERLNKTLSEYYRFNKKQRLIKSDIEENNAFAEDNKKKIKQWKNTNIILPLKKQLIDKKL